MFAAALLLALTAPSDTAYFQQRVEYRIEARLDEAREVLTGRLRLHYHNSSTTTLDTLWFHLHLNAFRPNSAWARRDLEFGERRFTNLGPNEHAFERVQRITVGGAAVTPVYPGAPDSTVMGVALPRSLAPADSVTVDMDWEARPSTLPRRQGRRARDYDFAQWYPRIAVFDRGGWQVQPLLPQGEFYGEFGSYDVTLDVARDQVIGATGVPVEGDPGWAGVAARTDARIDYRRDVYPQTRAVPLGLLADSAAADRKRIRWRAEDVHHFAWSTSPTYIYETGAYQDVAVHVLYHPGDTAWANGVAVARTERALAFYDTIFGRYPWPQLTNLHRIEGGGTEFPMMVMNGSASEGLILHEVGHNYAHGILANNEWREGWLDEGFVSFLTNLALAGRGVAVDWTRDLRTIREYEVNRATQPIAWPGAQFRDMSTYGAMTYTKTSLVFRMLHWLLGDAPFRSALRTYYEDNRLRHVREADLRAAMNKHYAAGLDWFFDQWIHTTNTLDYAIGELSVTQAADGSWTAQVEVIRNGDAWMPVELVVNGVTQRLESRAPRQTVTVRTSTRPTDAVVDPNQILLDIDPANNRKPFPR